MPAPRTRSSALWWSASRVAGRIALALLPVVAGPPAADAVVKSAIRFEFVNQTPQVVRGVYLCPADSPTWGENLLGDRAVKPGERVRLKLAGGCGRYALRIVGERGTEYLEDEVVLCADGDVFRVGEGRIRRSRAPQPPAE